MAPRPRRARFELDPGHLVRTEDQARAAGLLVLGTWHSHPDGPAEPSSADDAATWPGALLLVVALHSSPSPDSISRPESELRAWRRHDPAEGGGNWVEQAIRLALPSGRA